MEIFTPELLNQTLWGWETACCVWTSPPRGSDAHSLQWAPRQLAVDYLFSLLIKRDVHPSQVHNSHSEPDTVSHLICFLPWNQQPACVSSGSCSQKCSYFWASWFLVSFLFSISSRTCIKFNLNIVMRLPDSQFTYRFAYPNSFCRNPNSPEHNNIPRNIKRFLPSCKEWGPCLSHSSDWRNVVIGKRTFYTVSEVMNTCSPAPHEIPRLGKG